MTNTQTNTKTFYFNTGVNPINVTKFPSDYHKEKGNVIRGTLLIPFICEGVPDGAVFKFASPYDNVPHSDNIKVFKIVGGNLLSDYAYFLVND